MSGEVRLSISDIDTLREMVGMNNVLDVTVGKYRIIQLKTGSLQINRNNLHWRDATGDKLILCMAQEIGALREQVSRKEEEIDLIKQSISEDDEVVAGGRYERVSFINYLNYLLTTDIASNSLLKILIQDLISYVNLNEELIHLGINDIRDKAAGLQTTLQRVHESIKPYIYATKARTLKDISDLIEVALKYYGTKTRLEKEELTSSTEGLNG